MIFDFGLGTVVVADIAVEGSFRRDYLMSRQRCLRKQEFEIKIYIYCAFQSNCYSLLLLFYSPRRLFFPIVY